MRSGHEIVDGNIVHNDRVMTWEEADKRAGFRLDRRKNWAFIPDTNQIGLPELCEQVSYSTECSGCANHEDFHSLDGKGAGCSECGYTGRSRQIDFVPFITNPPCTKPKPVT